MEFRRAFPRYAELLRAFEARLVRERVIGGNLTLPGFGNDNVSDILVVTVKIGSIRWTVNSVARDNEQRADKPGRPSYYRNSLSNLRGRFVFPK